MASRGNNSHNKCNLPYFILYSQMLTTNLYINALEYQCITLHCSLERKKFLESEEEMIQGLVKEKARLCTQWGNSLPLHQHRKSIYFSLFLVSQMKLNNKRKTSLPLTVQCGLGQIISHPMRNVHSPGGYEGETNWQMRAPC